jgi:hypothetical protein
MLGSGSGKLPASAATAASIAAVAVSAATAAATTPAAASAAATTWAASAATATGTTSAATTAPKATTTAGATSAASCASTAAFTRRPGFIHHDITTHEILIIQNLDSTIGFFIVINLYKSEPAWLARKTVANQCDVGCCNSRLGK